MIHDNSNNSMMLARARPSSRKLDVAWLPNPDPTFKFTAIPCVFELSLGLGSQPKGPARARLV